MLNTLFFLAVVACFHVDEEAAALETDMIEELMDDEAAAKGYADDGESPDLHEDGDQAQMQLSEE